MYSDGPIRKYLKDAASGDPTPGGGSVSAMVGALGTTMAAMSANFTIGKKKYRDVEEECKQILARCDQNYKVLLELADADTEAYGHVSAAYAMPKDTTEQKAARAEAIQKALRIAMDVPLEAFHACADVIGDLERLVDIANKNLISDVGVAALHAYAGLRGCKLNVEINLAYMKDREFAAKQQEEIDAAEARAKAIADTVVEKVCAAIKKT